MKNNKITKYISIVCLIVFSMFTFLLNFSYSNKQQIKEVREQQRLEAIMENERPIIEAMSSSNFVVSDKTAKILNKTGFNEFRNAVNKGTTYSGYIITLETDLDFDGEAFVPVGTINSTRTNAYTFNGTFDGNGHALKNIKITSDTTNVKGDVGVFGYVSSGTIKNLTIVIDTLTITTAGKSMGGIVGSCDGKTEIKNCMVLAKSSSSKICTSNTTASVAMNVGGIVGYCNSDSSNNKTTTITQCANFVQLKNNVYGTACVGGIIGKIPSNAIISVTECYSSGSINGGSYSTSTTRVGGVVGCSDSSSITITECLNKASLTGLSTSSSVAGAEDKTHYTGSEACDLRDTSSKDVDKIRLTYNYRKQVSGSSRDIMVSGICGKTVGGTISKCVNLTASSNISSLSTTYYQEIDLFYGRNGETISDFSLNGQYRYGEAVNAYRNLYDYNEREISSGGSLSGNYSVDYGSYSDTYSSYNYCERVYYPTISGQDGKTFTFSKVALTDVFKGAFTDKIYAINPGYSSSSVRYGAKNYSSNFYDDLTLYSNGDWIYSGAHIMYDSSWGRQWNPAGYSYVLTTYSYPAIFGYYINTQTNEIITLDDFEGYVEGGRPSLSFGTGYTTNLDSRFRSANHDLSDEYKDDKKSIIKDCKVSSTWDNLVKKYYITFNYSYDYRVKSGFLNLGRSWKSTTGSISLGTFENKSGAVKTANTTRFTDKTNYSSVVSALGSKWCLSGGKPSLKWLYWQNNVDPVE